MAMSESVSIKSSSYDPVAKVAHWVTFALVAAQFAVGWLMPEIGWGTEPTGLIGLHLALGATLFVVIVLRLVWRITHPAPAQLQIPAWQRRIAGLTHFSLYVLLIAMSLTGWASSSAREWPVKAFGLIPLPDLVAPHAKIGFVLGDQHADLLCWIFLAVIVVHVAAALYHHFIKHDGVVRRMLP
jgi:cytochrome b561